MASVYEEKIKRNKKKIKLDSPEEVKAEEIVSEPEVQATETINVEEEKLDSKGKATIDFMNPDHVNDFIKKETKKSESENSSVFGKGKTVEEIRTQIASEEASKSSDWKPEDFEMIAEIIVMVIDSIAANALRFFAYDTAESAYSLPERKKSMLVRQLAMILIKYQAKFKIEFLFLLSLIMFYAPFFIKARKRRKHIKKLKALEAKSKAKTDEGEAFVHQEEEIIEPEVQIEEPPVEDAHIVDDVVDGKTTGRKFGKFSKKRRGGKPAK